MKRLVSILLLMGLLTLAAPVLAEEITTPEQTAITQAPDTPKMDTGDTSWLIVASAFVMLMTLPGLALFYGGLAKRKDSLNTMAMSFAAFCIASVLWVIYGYTLAFGEDILGIIGKPVKLMLNGITVDSLSGTIPEYVFVMFQLTFAAITVALVSGALIERLKFSAWILFCILWFTLSYVPVAHWVWGGGFLAKMGALDFAGGTVVHINAGIAALVGALILGKRKDVTLIPHNLTMVVTGAGLLWFGWFGFNAGSALAANGLAGAAFINTNTATAMASLSWMAAEWLYSKRPTVLGLASGAVAGLVAITPAAGFVNITGATIIGLLSGVLAFLAVAKVKPLLGYDDTLDAFGIHGVAGTVGALLTGIFADPSINSAGKGLLYGNPDQLFVQAIAVAVTMIYVAVVSSIIFLLIKLLIGIRVQKDDELIGLDESEHGEKAYNLHI
ncbi:MAG: ammonium transporter [Thermodesulfovibrionales bacterium]|nr:ammonium transporter [Thermodesulfovibrionales bacterium]